MPSIRSTISSAPLPTTIRRSSSIRNSPSPTTIAATRFDDKGDPDRAIADYNEALRADPNYAAALYNRGIAWRRKGDLDRAIADYDQAIRLNPTAAAYNNRGSAWLAKGESERAIADLDQAIKLDPRFADAYINRGNAKRERLDFAEARRRLHARHRAFAERRACLLQSRLGALSRRRKRPGAGRRRSRHRAQRPLGERVLDPRADPRAACRSRAGAIADFRKALEIDPSFQQPAEGLQRLKAGPASEPHDPRARRRSRTTASYR